MRTITFLICSLFTISAFGQGRNILEAIPFDNTKDYQKLFADDTEFDIRKFKPLPSFKKAYNHNKWLLVDAINPVRGYVYWECRYTPPDDVGKIGQLVVYKGDRTYGKLALLKSNWGFFVECLPSMCYSYIVAVRADKSVELIDGEEKLIEFMGAVDNMEEVLLHIKARGYWYDEDTLIGGAYREESDRYLLYLMEYSSFPVTFKSVKAILYKTGKFEVVSEVIYKMDDIMIIS